MLTEILVQNGQNLTHLAQIADGKIAARKNLPGATRLTDLFNRTVIFGWERISTGVDSDDWNPDAEIDTKAVRVGVCNRKRRRPCFRRTVWTTHGQ